MYFQVTHPRFNLTVKRVSDEELQSKRLLFYMQFSDAAKIEFPVDVSNLKTWETITCKTQRILLSPSGDARICLDTGKSLGAPSDSFLTLYAFVVSAEATLVFLMLNVVVGAILALLLRL